MCSSQWVKSMHAMKKNVWRNISLVRIFKAAAPQTSNRPLIPDVTQNVRRFFALDLTATCPRSISFQHIQTQRLNVISGNDLNHQLVPTQIPTLTPQLSRTSMNKNYCSLKFLLQRKINIIFLNMINIYICRFHESF